MKKYLLALIFLILLQSNCSANTLKAIALNDFTTLDNQAKIKVYVAENFYMTTKLLIPEGSVLVGSIANITEPKRLKKDANFDFVVFYYMNDKKYKYKAELPIVGSYSKILKMDKNQTGKKATQAATNKIVPGSGHVRNAYNGAKQRKKGRIKGIGSSIYQHSILSWKDKGSHLNIKKGDFFYINFPMYKQDEYTFETVFTQIDNYGNPLLDKKLSTQNKPLGADLEPNYPYKHQYNSRVFYMSRPKKEKDLQ